jgi:hypothetical protein
MTVDEFDVLIRAIHREWTLNPKFVSVTDGSMFFYHPTAVTANYIYLPQSLSRVWVTLDKIEFQVFEPWFFSKNRKKFNTASDILKNIMKKEIGHTTTEELICKLVPSAKDIIAEQNLIDDNKGPV